MEKILPGRTTTAVAQIVDELKQMIIQQDLQVGDRLPNEADLCKQFGKSRGSVREAIKILEFYGVLTVRQGDGTYLQASPDAGMYDALFFRIMAKGSDFRELLEMRQIIETGILTLAVARNDHAAIDVIRRVQKDLEALTAVHAPIEDLVALDLAFHVALADAAGNGALKDIYVNLLQLFSPFIYDSYIPQQTLGYTVVSQHNRILEALEERDADLAAYAIRSALKDWKKLNDQVQTGRDRL